MHVPNPVDLVLKKKTRLVGGFNPSDRQIGSFFQVGMKIKNIGNHQVDYLSGWEPWLVQVAFFFTHLVGPALRFTHLVSGNCRFFRVSVWITSHNHQHSPTIGDTFSAIRTPLKVPNCQTSWDKLYANVNWMFTSTKKHVKINQLDLYDCPPQDADSSENHHQDDERILGSRIRNSKVVSTHLWNTPLNLYQRAIKGFLS